MAVDSDRDGVLGAVGETVLGLQWCHSVFNQICAMSFTKLRAAKPCHSHHFFGIVIVDVLCNRV